MFELMPAITVYSVTQLNRYIRQWLESDVGVVEVEGEISNVALPSSGHIYFTLKDANAQIKCVYFKQHHPRGKPHAIEHGQKIIARGRLSLYEARGDYQLIVEGVSVAGHGDLYHQFELLKLKCAAAGLFDQARKRSLPKFPSCIGVVTSASAAAWRDIMVTLARRYPLAPIILYASDVQGKLAAGQLRQAIIRANQEKKCDVIILARGGGSIEDLWAFNDEALAYTIRDSIIPIVSGVGHETDFTIADFVSDLRAATPTAAAEAVTPNQEELLLWLNNVKRRIIECMRRYLLQQFLLLTNYKKRLTSPDRLIATHAQTLDYIERRLINSMDRGLKNNLHALKILDARLHAQHPKNLITNALSQVQQLNNILLNLMHNKLTQAKQKFTQQLTTLNAVSPLATLERGYSVVMQENHVVFASQDVDPKKPLNIRLARGELECYIVKDASLEERQ